ncbi:winged helix-turn-helix domain-containing protein [Venatoribacter cucullus]|uniref:winged helix-turn-helix domain-containing protein n=1 Tax=Venatoribacter cucullus TaxID=2661630 RepID=UPI002240A4AD|nr:winged helix-turn-helix domain-containing protein [Venatoribacter cucullus]UZK03888.1 winged helix-turn-helix transcriptional regulator [Venatoribacter cucullus]
MDAGATELIKLYTNFPELTSLECRLLYRLKSLWTDENGFRLMTIAEMERVFGLKRQSFSDSLDALIRLGVLKKSVSQVLPGKGRTPAVYHINPESHLLRRLESTTIAVEGVFHSTISSLCLGELNAMSVQIGIKTYKLSHAYRLLLALLLKHADVFGVIEGVSRQELARQTRLSLNTVKFYLKDMEEKGILKRQFYGANYLSWLPKAKSIYQLNLVDVGDYDHLSSRYRWSMRVFRYKSFRLAVESVDTIRREVGLTEVWGQILKNIKNEKDASYPYLMSIVDALATRSLCNLKVRPEGGDAQLFVAYMADSLDVLLSMLKLSGKDEEAFRKLVGGSFSDVPADIGTVPVILFALSLLSYKLYRDAYRSLPRAYRELLIGGKIRSLRVSTLFGEKLILPKLSGQYRSDIPARLRVSMIFHDFQGELPPSEVNLYGFEDQFGKDQQDILHNCNVIGLPLADLANVNGLIHESRSNPVNPDR